MSTRLAFRDFFQQSQGQLIIDVRSPGEYTHAHLPGAKSLPLFTDEERKIVGTAYKQESREKAIKLGLDFFGPKMRPMVEQVEDWLKMNASDAPQHQQVFVYCWRGGMRSGAISWLLNLYGFKVFTLQGGYKSFRQEVISTWEENYAFHVLGGYTGSGKTALLQALEKTGATVIDLEGIASHKGSAFGNLHMPPQPTQEMFENLLALALWDKAGQPGEDHRQAIWLEDESQRIGDLNIPIQLWNNMRRSTLYFLEIPFEERLQNITLEYGDAPLQRLKDATTRISKRLGGLETKNCLAFLEEGNIKEAFRILLHYYDKRYLKGLHNRENLETLLLKVPCERVGPENLILLQHQHQPS